MHFPKKHTKTDSVFQVILELYRGGKWQFPHKTIEPMCANTGQKVSDKNISVVNVFKIDTMSQIVPGYKVSIPEIS